VRHARLLYCHPLDAAPLVPVRHSTGPALLRIALLCLQTSRAGRPEQKEGCDDPLCHVPQVRNAALRNLGAMMAQRRELLSSLSVRRFLLPSSFLFTYGASRNACDG
jgi:hypothetical protein